MAKPKVYIGIDNDLNGGLTSTGKIVLDARVFELIPETETCENWTATGMDALLDKVNKEWDKYGCLVSQLPAEIRERHDRIYNQVINKAKAAGWSGEVETDDED
jgi:L-rhamnose mutarotase